MAKVELLRVKFEVNYRNKAVDMQNEDHPSVLRTVLRQFFDEVGHTHCFHSVMAYYGIFHQNNTMLFSKVF